MVGVSHSGSRESTIPRGPWQNAAMPPPDISTSDGDLLGLRYLSESALRTLRIQSLFSGRWCQVLGLGKLFPQNPLQLQGFYYILGCFWILYKLGKQ